LYFTGVGGVNVGAGVAEAEGFTSVFEVLLTLLAAVADGVSPGDEERLAQPAINKEAITRDRTIIAVIGFNCIR
jgi:hypothetical protein